MTTTQCTHSRTTMRGTDHHCNDCGVSMTPEQFQRSEQARHLEAREESFERSDTDGFLTQWAHGISANKAGIQADIERRNGRARMRGLFDGDRRLAAKCIETRYGWAWLLRDDEADRYGRRFVPAHGSHSNPGRVIKSLGLREAWELAPAVATILGEGRGLSGRAWAAAVRKDSKTWGTDAIIDPDQSEDGDA